MQTNKELGQKAYELYGKDKQLEILVEECAEVIHAIQKIKRADNVNAELLALDHFYSELADLFIIGNQVAEFYLDYYVLKDFILKKERKLSQKILKTELYNGTSTI